MTARQTGPREATGAARKLARILDSAFRLPGTQYRFGIDPILGLFPGLGDAIGGGFGFYLLVLAFRAGAPPVVLLRMFINIAVDMLFGSIPLLGDLLDAGYKANLRNLALLEHYLERPKQTTTKSVAIVVILLIVLLVMIAVAIRLAVAAVQAVFGWIF